VPQISQIVLNNQSAFDDVYLLSGKDYKASVEVVDADGDDIRYLWEVRPESTSNKVGGDAEYVPSLVEGSIKNHAATIQLTTPEEAGPYRLFVYAFDGNNSAAHANIPFYVK
jgi:hypothetical protein